ncbi:MAG TPA: metallophosphoesterase [Thermomicrobiales bacterium]|nr:metallophosphoesterase [Thermomicrobiales bacterium]
MGNELDEQRLTSTSLIPSLHPRGAGQTFVWYGDCCSGVPGADNERHFAAVNAVFQRLATQPDVVLFPGDNIAGNPGVSAEDTRAMWRYWLDREMAWFYDLDIPIYHTTSNHNTGDAVAEAVFREILTDIPQNGPDDQKGLSYWVRRDDFLYVFVNTNFSGLGGSGHVEHKWLDRVLAENADATYKLVIGHHPIFPTNGYDMHPGWHVDPDQGAAFWDVLVRHGVIAYLCSHILAFDAQVHDGILQVMTGGAVVGVMPEAFEYAHLIQTAIDETGIRYQVLDTEGVAREWLQWPEPALDAPLAPLDIANPPVTPAPLAGDDESAAAWIARFRISGGLTAADHEQTLLTVWTAMDGPEGLWIGTAGPNNRLTVQLVPQQGRGAQRWEGPELAADQPFDLEIAIHSGMGPGGVLWRPAGGAWNSLSHSTAEGAARFTWPETWQLGHSQSGESDRAFAGSGLAIQYRFDTVSRADLFASHPVVVTE